MFYSLRASDFCRASPDIQEFLFPSSVSNFLPFHRLACDSRLSAANGFTLRFQIWTGDKGKTSNWHDCFLQ